MHKLWGIAVQGLKLHLKMKLPECFTHFKHGNFQVHTSISILHFAFAHNESFRVHNKNSHKTFFLLWTQNQILLSSISTRITPPPLILSVWLFFFNIIFVVNDFLTTVNVLPILIHYNFGNFYFTYIFDFKDLGFCFRHFLGPIFSLSGNRRSQKYHTAAQVWLCKRFQPA